VVDQRQVIASNIFWIALHLFTVFACLDTIFICTAFDDLAVMFAKWAGGATYSF
jgi:hypothetical protein